MANNFWIYLSSYYEKNDNNSHSMQDHITNHRAKTILYLHLNDITPPSYGLN